MFNFFGSISTITRLKIRFLQVLAGVGFVAICLQIILQFIYLFAGSENASLPTMALLFLMAGVSVYLYQLIQQGNIDRAATAMIAILVVNFFLSHDSSTVFFSAALTVIFGAFLANRLVFYGANAIIVAELSRLLFILLVDQELNLTNEVVIHATQIVILLVIMIATRVFVITAEHTAQQAQRTADLLRATSEIGQITAQLFDIGELFNRAIELVRDRFAYYHVQIFMVDENREYAVLVSSTGRAGQQLLNRGHRLVIGSTSVIGRVTQLGEIVIARDAEEDAVHFRNELLPSTRSEMAVPIMDGDRIIGALDVQSTRRDAFDSTDIQALQVMANQLGTSIRNVRLFEAQETSVQENKRLFLESESSLREIQRLNRRLTKEAWQEYLTGQRRELGVVADAKGTSRETRWSRQMMDATLRQRPIKDGVRIAVPLMLRGEVIGAIEVDFATQLHEDDTIEMIQTVAQRLAVSLDNARLFEEAQEATLHEQRINDIVSGYQSANTVDDLLRITITEMNRALGAESGHIRLGVLQTDAPQNGHLSQNGHQNNGDEA